MADTHRRTIVKAIVWEIVSNAVCLVLAHMIFGNWSGCLIFTGICVVLKLLMYYVHERVWHFIKWGKAKCPFCLERLSLTVETTMSEDFDRFDDDDDFDEFDDEFDDDDLDDWDDDWDDDFDDDDEDC